MTILFLFGLWHLYELRFSAGDIFPAYSSLRADPLGSKALYEALAQLPGNSVARNFGDLSQIHGGDATILYLGQDPFIFEAQTEESLKRFEDLASTGARVVIAMQPVRRLPEPPVKKPVEHEKPAIEMKWGIRFGYLTRNVAADEEDSSSPPKLTVLFFQSEEKIAYRVERNFGKGTVVLMASCYPFSNEALRQERKPELLIWALAGRPRIVFDEHHLGLTESGSVAGLARKYHLEGFVAALLALAGLFLWKSSTSFLPRNSDDSEAPRSVRAKDSRTALANLMRRNIPTHSLIGTCVAEWEKTQVGSHRTPPEKVDQIRGLAARPGEPVALYRKASRILAERSWK